MTDTSNVRLPRIEFPCGRYPIKVIGDAGEGLSDLVVEITQRHAPDLDAETPAVRDSSKGRFLSVQVPTTATDVGRPRVIYNDLRAIGRVYMVL